MNMFPRRVVAHLLILALGGSMIASCSEPPAEKISPPNPSAPTDDVRRFVRIAADTNGSPTAAAPITTARIMDIMPGGASGEWGVVVQFPAGVGHGCAVEVVNMQSGDLLARNELTESGAGEQTHVIRFRHGGSVADLHIRVIEKKSGAILTETGKD